MSLFRHMPSARSTVCPHSGFQLNFSKLLVSRVAFQVEYGGETMRILISTVALVACTSLASAADLGGPYGGSLKDEPIAAAPFSWTGLYIGAHAGWATGEWDGNLVYDEGAGPVDIWDGNSSRSIDTDGFVGGGQIGFNLQSGSFVYGIEADATWADLEESRAFPFAQGSMDWTIKAQVDAFGTVRARLGYLVKPTLLLYGTGGLAWAKTSMDLTVHNVVPAPTIVTARGSADETHIGWAAGAGAEWAFAPNWSFKAEWLRVDLGEEDYHLTGTNLLADIPHTTDSYKADLTFDVFRVGVNYKFGR